MVFTDEGSLRKARLHVPDLKEWSYLGVTRRFTFIQVKNHSTCVICLIFFLIQWSFEFIGLERYEKHFFFNDKSLISYKNG